MGRPSPDERQQRYEKRYYERWDRDRPKPAYELHVLADLAKQAKASPSKALDWTVAATPENFCDALEADLWDKRNPFYDCIECKDGARLPPVGYVCNVCGAESAG